MAGTNEDTVLSQYVPGFKANLNLAPQQTDCRLLPACDGELAYDVPGQMFNADDVQLSDPEDIVTRVPNTPDKFIAMIRRVGYFVPYQDAAWLDKVDIARELVDPTGKVMMALMAGRWRKVDRAIIAGLLGNAYSLTAPNTAPTASGLPAAQLVANNDVLYQHDAEVLPTNSSSYGMSVAKIIHAGLILDDSNMVGERFLAIGPAQKADLLRRTPVTSRYYNDVTALIKGEIDNFLGFNIIRLPRLQMTGVLGFDGVNYDRYCPAWIKDAVVYKSRPVEEATIMRRPDKSNTPQAFYKTEHGAVRRYDTAVVQISCYEGAAH